MGTSAEILLLVKNGKQYTIRTECDGDYFSCGKHLWEWLRDLTSEEWDRLNERLEKVTWVNEYDEACTHGLYNMVCRPRVFPREPTEYTMIDVLHTEYYEPFKVLRSVMDDRTQHMIDFESSYADYQYQIDFISKEFSVFDPDANEYVEMPFTCKRARLLLGSKKSIGKVDSK